VEAGREAADDGRPARREIAGELRGNLEPVRCRAPRADDGDRQDAVVVQRAAHAELGRRRELTQARRVARTAGYEPIDDDRHGGGESEAAGGEGQRLTADTPRGVAPRAGAGARALSRPPRWQDTRGPRVATPSARASCREGSCTRARSAAARRPRSATTAPSRRRAETLRARADSRAARSTPLRSSTARLRPVDVWGRSRCSPENRGQPAHARAHGSSPPPARTAG